MSTNAVFASMSSQAATADAKPMRLDANVANEVNALWRSIFERAHANETHGENPRKPVAPEPSTHPEKDAKEFVRARAEERDAKQTRPLPERLQVSVPAPDEATAAPASHAASLPASSIENARNIVDSESRPSVTTSSAARLASEDVEIAAPAAKRAPPNSDAASVTPERTSDAESVSVFMQGGAVTINVRDADLREDEALRCAFETARTLTGERAALRTLMLNGRTVYRQALRPEVADAPTLIFAC